MLIPGETKLRATEEWRKSFSRDILPGDTGTFNSGADYIPGWDAGRWDVKLDNPRTQRPFSCHWTAQELLTYWEIIS